MQKNRKKKKKLTIYPSAGPLLCFQANVPVSGTPPSPPLPSPPSSTSNKESTAAKFHPPMLLLLSAGGGKKADGRSWLCTGRGVVRCVHVRTS